MIWQNPWAWLGLTAIAAPLLVHLLARRRARPLPFPTLRFLDAARIMLARRDRLTDLALLSVRIGIVIAAVAALAQPFVSTPGRDRARQSDPSVARAVIVDTSASMRRTTPIGGTALEAALREGRRLAADAATGTMQESAVPAQALAAARGWLATQSGRREVVVVSDFQTGSVDARDLATLSADTGVRLVRIDVAPSAAPLTAVSRAGALDTTATVTLSPARTDVVWTSRAHDDRTGDGAPTLLAGAAERAAANAAADAARALGGARSPAGHDVAIVFPLFDERAALMNSATPLTEPWMFDVVSHLRHDAMLADATRTEAATGSTVTPASLIPLVSDASGQPLILAASDRVDGHGRLLLFSSANAGSLVSAALIASATIAASPASPVAELDPSTIADDVLRQWQREPGTTAAPVLQDGRGASDGRWLWVLAVLLLGVETWMRRTTRSQPAAEVDHARVA